MITITRAETRDAAEIAVLFDLYRQFYEQAADLSGCESYIHARLDQNESVIFLARDETGQAVAFTQLYISWCSVAMNKLVHLYDLYVHQSVRRQGVGRQLMDAAREFSQDLGADRMCLETAVDNYPAQPLYESLGYVKDQDFYSYYLEMRQ
jgi:ribosomal protein S18 acetylase RimI-like enzyme